MKRIFSSGYNDMALSAGLFIMRAAAGGMIIPAGYMKIKKFSEFSSHFTDPFHIGSSLSLSLCIFAEFFGGILLVLGLFTRLASIPLIINMAVIVFYINHGKISGDGQFPALLLAGYLALLFTGPGKFSLDKMIGK